MSLADQILKLSNTAPDFEDSDDDFTAAQLIDRKDLGDDGSDADDVRKRSQLRTKTATLLDDEDIRYKGRHTSRKSLQEEEDDDEEEIHDESLEDSSDEEEWTSLSEDGSASVADDVNNEDEGVRRMRNMQLGNVARVLGEGHSDQSEDESGSEDKSENDEDMSGDSDNEKEELEVENDEDEEDIDIKPKTNSRNKDSEKGKFTRAQIGFWDRWMEIRIKFRKLQSPINQLPSVVNNGVETVAEWQKHADKDIMTLCNHLMFTQTCSLLQNPDTRQVVGGQAALQQTQKKEKDEDEITSESEVSDDEDDAKSLNLTGVKRQLDAPAYPEFLAKRNAGFTAFRNSVIQKWNEKTNLDGGKGQKSFGAFEQSTLKQIEQTLLDKERLKKRTQLNRSRVKIVGIPDVVTKPNDGNETSTEAGSAEVRSDKQEELLSSAARERLYKSTQLRNELTFQPSLGSLLGVTEDEAATRIKSLRTQVLKRGNPIYKDRGSPCLGRLLSAEDRHEEIFDDDDFYHNLLREVIERKSVKTDDPIALSRQWLDMQKYKTKVKKVVDTKASKGRKIRYHVHAKLINFMAPDDRTTWSDEQRDELFKSLYGYRFESITGK